jgi:hypothetical protein
MRKYRDYSNEDIIKFAKEVKSIAGLLLKLNLKPAGGNYANVKNLLQKLNVDTSHWTGKAWNKNERLKDWSKYSRVVNLKKHLINSRGHKCEECKFEIWINTPIPLEVHHVDGDRTNNKIDNLKLLCCNCHSLTHNWKNRKLRLDRKENVS